MPLWEKLFKKPASKLGEEGLDERLEEYKIEAELEQRSKSWKAEDATGKQERTAAVAALGAEKATTEQIRHLRKEIGEEEEKKAERHAQVQVTGPEKATKEQAETFKPLGKEDKMEEIQQDEEEKEKIEYKKAA